MTGVFPKYASIFQYWETRFLATLKYVIFLKERETESTAGTRVFAAGHRIPRLSQFSILPKTWMVNSTTDSVSYHRILSPKPSYFLK